jgi:hypothetical protein
VSAGRPGGGWRGGALVLLACAASIPVPAAAAARTALDPAAHAFVSEYRCAGERTLVVSYPAPRYRHREPVRLAWNGETVALGAAAPRRGLRWTSRDADLAWITQGRNGTLRRVSDQAVLLAGCIEQ